MPRHFPSMETLRKIIDDLTQESPEVREKDVASYRVSERGEATPITLQHEFDNGYIQWRRGEKFNFRVFMALLMTDKASAKTYYFTTTS